MNPAGWGIDEVGMKTYSTMRLHEPDFFIHLAEKKYVPTSEQEGS